MSMLRIVAGGFLFAVVPGCAAGNNGPADRQATNAKNINEKASGLAESPWSAEQLRHAMLQEFGSDRVGDQDFGYNPTSQAVGLQYTAQKKGEPLPTRQKLVADVEKFFQVLERSHLSWKIADITAYGVNPIDQGEADKTLIDGFWRIEQVRPFLGSNGETMLAHTAAPAVIDPSVR